MIFPAESILKTLEMAKIKPYSKEEKDSTEKKIEELLKRRRYKMREILGDNLEQFFGNVDFPEDSIIGRSYKGDMYEVWSVPEEVFQKMCDMSEEEFARLAGEGAWWRGSNGSNMGGFNAEYIINGKKILAWDDHRIGRYQDLCMECSDRVNGLCKGNEEDFDECFGERKYNNLLEYFEYEIGATAERNIISLAIDLAKFNNMTVGQLFSEYQG